MNEAVEDGICECGVAYGFVPVVNRELACDDGGGATVAVFEDFQEVTALWGGEDGQAPIVDDQHIHSGDGFKDAFMATVTAGKREGFEHARGPLIEDGPPIPASLVTQCAGNPTFAKAGRTSYQQVLMPGDPTAIRKMGHDTAVKPTRRAQVQILDAGILAQGGELQPRGELFAVTLSGLAVDQQAESVLEREVVKGARPSLLFQRLGNAGQAESQQSVMGGMGQHFGPFSVIIAAATDVGVLEGGGLCGAFEEGAIEAGLED